MKRTSSQQRYHFVPFSCCEGNLCYFNVSTPNKPSIPHADIIKYMTLHQQIVSGYSQHELKDKLENDVCAAISRNEKIVKLETEAL